MADIGRGNYRYRRTGLDMADEIFQFLLVGIIGIYGQSFGLAVAIDRGGAGCRRDVFQVGTSPHMVTVCLFIANNIQLCRKGESAGHLQDSLSRSFHTVFKDQGCCHMVPAADAVLVADSHALFAAQNGLQEAAEKYFKKALYLDLHEIMNNTGKEGLHLACLGETWSSIFFGFLGATFDGDTPTFSPALPTGWKALRTNFYWQGKIYHLAISDNHYTVTKA